MTGSADNLEAARMLNLMASVGAVRFDVTWTTEWRREADTTWTAIPKEKLLFRRGVPLNELRRAIPGNLDFATANRRNVIVRPDADNRTFVQLDDLTADQLPRIAPPVFLILQTSSASYQAWLALEGGEDKALTRRLKDRTKADVNATGATRIAGSLNFKPEHAPDFPCVAIHTAQPGRTTTAAELESLGLVAAKQPEPPPLKAPTLRGERPWPSYAICLERAPINNRKDGPDTSKADLSFCMIAITGGHGVEETARRLVEEPDSKAHQRGEAFALEVARKAALFVAQNRQRRHRIG